jgi:SAM-dependent methyltransferase
MTDLRQILQQISGSMMLDVATGYGNFIHYLKEHLPEPHTFVGIDTSHKALQAASSKERSPDIHFLCMDAGRMGFADGVFDMTAIAYSLHHMSDLQGTLSEVLRVLKPGGKLLIWEMYKDDQTPAQLSHVHMHHWSAEIDTALGITHYETFDRQEIVEIVQALNLETPAFVDDKDLGSDPLNEGILESQIAVIDRVLERARDLPGYAGFAQRAEEIRQHLLEHGIHGATSLVCTGTKPH